MCNLNFNNKFVNSVLNFKISSFLNLLVNRCFFFFLLTCPILIHAQNSYSLRSIPMQLVTGANSVILEESKTLDLTDNGKLQKHTCRVYVVLNELGSKHVITGIRYGILFTDNGKD